MSRKHPHKQFLGRYDIETLNAALSLRGVRRGGGVGGAMLQALTIPQAIASLEENLSNAGQTAYIKRLGANSSA